MPVEIALEVKPYGFVPLTAIDQEQHRLFAVGSTVKAKIVKQKSRPLLRFYWALVQEIANGVGYGKYQLSHELLCRLKRIDAYHCKDGSVFVVPKSIAEMNHGDFRDYVTEVVPLLFGGDYADKESKPEIIRIAEKRSRTTLRDAMKEEKENE